MKKNFKTKGFSLVELSAVFLIVGAVIAFSIVSLGSQVTTQEIASTRQKIEAVKTALENYRTKYNSYPCPSLNTTASNAATYGQAQANCFTSCPAGLTCTTNPVNVAVMATARGSIPFSTLGLPESVTVDAWGGKIEYAVDARFTQAENNCQATGGITIVDLANNTVSNRAVYAVISHGTNRSGAYAPSTGTIASVCGTTLDLENCDANATFRMGEINKSDTTATYYDDIIGFNVNSQYTAAPAGLPTMQAWYDAADKCTITTNGSNVLQVLDKSGNGQTLTQATVANQPQYPGGSKINNIYPISFTTASPQVLVGPASAGALSRGPYTFVTIFQTSTTSSMSVVEGVAAGWERWHGIPTNATGQATPTTFVGQFKSYIFPGAVQELNSNSPSPAYNDGLPHIAITTVGATAPTAGQYLFMDGLQQTATTAGTTTSNYAATYRIMIGQYPSWTGTQQVGFQFLEYMYFGTQLNATQRQTIEQYASKKWGIRLN